MTAHEFDTGDDADGGSRSDATVATRVVVSHPAALSTWGRDQLTASRFVGYLRRTMGTVAVGDEFEEFLDVGCCGDSLDVTLRVEAVDGGARVGDATRIEFAEREADLEGGWLVQSAAGPSDYGR
jgi:hypothetical protein